jgi:multiple sugar transport system substrate-binding protein
MKIIRLNLYFNMFFFSAAMLLFTSCNSCNNKEKQTIITVIGENSSNLNAMEQLKGSYELANKNIKIDFKKETFDDALNKSNQDFANQTGLYDIVLQYNFSLSSFVRNKYVGDIDELTKAMPEEMKAFEKDIFPNVWQEVGYYYKDALDLPKGNIKVGYPFAANTMLLVYNKQMFENTTYKEEYKKKYKQELVPPTDWQQYKNIAEFFTNKEKGTYGIAMQGAEGGWLYYEYCNYLFSNGGTVMKKQQGWEGDETTPLMLTSNEAIQATKFFYSLKPYNAGNYTKVDVNEQAELMKGNKTAMCIMWSDYLFTLAKDKPDMFGFAPIPGNKSMIAGGSFYINSKSKNPQDAAKYIIHLLQPSSQVELAKNGLCSPMKSTYENVDVKKAIPYADALKVSLERGVYMLEAGPDADVISVTLTNYLQRMWNGEITPEDALAKAQADITAKRKVIFNDLRGIKK